MANPLVEKLNTQTFHRMINKCLDEMSGHQSPPTYNDFCSDISEEEFHLIYASIKHNLCGYIKKGESYDWEQLKPSHSECLRDVFQTRHRDIIALVAIQAFERTNADWNDGNVASLQTIFSFFLGFTG
jgi:hypothetical protein